MPPPADLGAAVYDLFGAVLYLLGLPDPEGLPGRRLAEAIHEVLRRHWSIRKRATFERRNTGDPTPVPTSVDESYLDELRALGYVVN